MPEKIPMPKAWNHFDLPLEHGIRHHWTMINNTSLQTWKRMEAKRLDHVFRHEIQTGLNCSPFESEAILRKVHEVFDLLFNASDQVQPGQIRLPVVAVEAHAGQSLAEAPQTMVTLTLDDPDEDLTIRKEQGVGGLRRHRMIRMATEALRQGGVLTLEDFAIRIFNCGMRTLSRDLDTLRAQGVTVPLRSTVKDMGRTLSHRHEIVRAWLSGKEYSEIARETHHSVLAVRNYVETFRKIAVLNDKSLNTETLAFLVGVSIPLAETYLALLKQSDGAAHRLAELSASEIKKNVIPFDQGASRD